MTITWIQIKDRLKKKVDAAQYFEKSTSLFHYLNYNTEIIFANLINTIRSA